MAANLLSSANGHTQARQQLGWQETAVVSGVAWSVLLYDSFFIFAAAFQIAPSKR